VRQRAMQVGRHTSERGLQNLQRIAVRDERHTRARGECRLEMGNQCSDAGNDRGNAAQREAQRKRSGADANQQTRSIQRGCYLSTLSHVCCKPPSSAS
jgi:hypothetical protein